ncbi:MAG: hypothetical protein LBI05_09545 [Planctomycetaceae bacterium]|jgi:hypothetical protein|nr:hypothetical protein [Planctomycetaceae bacterium]
MTEIPNTENLRETVCTAGSAVRIDRDAGVIFGVKIIGCESRNGRHYPNDTLRNAIPLYENSKVNLDHPDGDPRKSRSYQARFGMIRNVQLRENDGLFADFWFNPKHSLAEQLLWDAEHAPENVGFSHNVEAVVKRQQSTALVEKIVAVRSVDLVADPAATQGLFESVATPAITLEQVERLIEERLQQFQRDVKPQSREQIVTESAFDSKAFATAVKRS